MLTTKQSALIGATALFAVLSNTVPGKAAGPDVTERLEQSRNLGKAFYENPTTSAEAVAEFKKALDLAPTSDREKLNYALALMRAAKPDVAVPILKDVQKHDPSLPHTWFKLGIYYKTQGEDELAIAQFRQMLKLTPNEPIAHYQLATLVKPDNPQEAIAEFEKAEKLNPDLGAVHYQLYGLYRQAGRNADSGRELQAFQDLKKQQEGAAIAEDVDWCNYAEIYDPPRAVTPVTNATPPVYDDTTLDGKVDAKSAGMLLIDSTGKGQTDLLVWSSNGIALYAQGAKKVVDAGLNDVKDAVFVAAGDFDNDGLMDLCVLTPTGAAIYRNTGGKFAKSTMALPQRRFERAIWIDYDHDYDLDLFLLGDKPALIRNQGTAGFADRTADFPFAAGHPVDAWKLRAVPDTKAFDLAVIYANRAPVLYGDQLGGHYSAGSFAGAARDLTHVDADFDGDGRMDRARIAPDGTVHVQHNRTASPQHWIRVQLTGVKSLKLAQDAEVEIKAGLIYRKQLYDGFPLTFDTGAYASVDTVRITWSNGLIQNETRQPANKAYKYEEAQRLSGSCPMVWTWNGSGFEFITDVLGVAPLGASDGDGTYFPVDHDEFVSIPGNSLKPVNGYYDVRITEELSEVSYLDQVRLFAVDHPADTAIYTNEKFKSPPYPEERLFGVKHRIYPVSAREFSGGNKPLDVLPLLMKTDQRSTRIQFARKGIRCSGEAHPGTGFRECGEIGHGSFTAARLGGLARRQHLPRGIAGTQVWSHDALPPDAGCAAGNWQTVNQDMGMPAGKPKTIAVALKFLSASRKVRIVTNLSVYWDEVFLSEDAAPPVVSQRRSSDRLGRSGISGVFRLPDRRRP